MQTGERATLQNGSALQYRPIAVQQRLPLHEALLLLGYHLRLLNWWLFLLMGLGFLGAGGLLWLQVRTGDPHALSDAAQVSQFVMESGAGLLAGLLAGSLIIGDPLLEVLMATRTGLHRLALWRALLTLFFLMACSAAYLAWSLENRISYARQQSALFLLLVWLAPVLIMGMLGLFGSLCTRNAVLGTVIGAIPLVGALLLHEKLLPIQATHPLFIPYTLWGHDAPDWWTNRLTLLAIALVLAGWNWWLLGREERLLADAR